MGMYFVKDWYCKPLKDDAIYGAEWAGTSDPSWVRTDAAVGFSSPNPYYSGMSTTPSSPFDNIMPWSGMRRVTDANAGELVEIPKFYYKLSQINTVGIKIQISMGEFDGATVDPMHMNRGDGVGERDYAYIGRYHCSSRNYKSASGVNPKVSITRATARTAIHNLGSNVWQYDFAARFTLWLLYLVEFANWNSQSMIGYGCGNNLSAQNMGYTDSMPYHTGTTMSSKTTYGLGTQYRYIEGLWDNVQDLTDGCYFISNRLNIILNPANFSDSSGGINVGTASDGNPSKIGVKNISNIFPLFMPIQSGGSTTTYMCDSWDNLSYLCPIAGGFFDAESLNCGLFYFYCIGSGDSFSNTGTRLMVLPPSRLSA